MNDPTAAAAADESADSATARTSREPNHAVGGRPTSAACSAVPIPNPTATGTGESARAAISPARVEGSSSRSPVVEVSETR